VQKNSCIEWRAVIAAAPIVARHRALHDSRPRVARKGNVLQAARRTVQCKKK
jgi:hypothetical protein